MDTMDGKHENLEASLQSPGIPHGSCEEASIASAITATEVVTNRTEEIQSSGIEWYVAGLCYLPTTGLSDD